MNLKKIEKAFKESEAIKTCKERLIFLTKGRGNVDTLSENLWQDFKNRIEAEEEAIDIEENVEKNEKAEGSEEESVKEVTENQEEMCTNVQPKEDVKEELKEEPKEEQKEEQKGEEPEKYQHFVSRLMKEGKTLKEIGQLWKEEKAKR